METVDNISSGVKCMMFDGDDDVDSNDEDWMYSSPAADNESKGVETDDSSLTSDYYSRPQTYQDWLDKIEDRYFDERDDLVRQILQTAYNEVDSPFSFIIHIVHRAFFDLYSKRLPISFLALDEMSNWLSLKGANNEFVPEPTESNKRMATEFVCRSGYNYLDGINHVFKLDKDDNSFIASYVQLDNLKSKKLKETVTIILTLKLQHCFDCEEIFLPLIANDQLQLVEKYVGEDTKLQNDYVGFLNKILKMTPSQIEQLLIEHGLTCKDPSKMKHKTLTRIAERAVKRYELNPDDFPYIFGAKNISSLFYLIKMRLQERRNGGSKAKLNKWDDLIENAVSNKLWLQLKLLDRLIDQNEIELAVSWTKRLQVPPKQLPIALIDEMGLHHHLINNDVNNRSNDVDGSADAEQEDWDAEVESEPSTGFTLGKGFYESQEESDFDDGGCNGSDESSCGEFYQLSISRDSIILVDNVSKLKEMTQCLFKDGNIIGFDAEWKPVMCRAGEKEYMSILQLAISGRVYILDLMVLYTTQGAEELLKTFFFQFFTKRSVTKVGYGITGDLKLIIGMFGYAKEMIMNSASLVDLFELSQKIIPHHKVQQELYNIDNRALIDKGLSMLVNRTLGKSLDKTFQVSDWERRPLRAEQLYYAALDAYCLLEVYDKLCYFVQKFDLKFNTKEKVKTKWLKQKANTGQRKDKYERKEHKEKMVLPDNKPLFKGIPRASTTLKVVCDTMLQGLGRQLRNCGVDTHILDDGSDYQDALQISHKEKRVILTRGKPFFMVRGYVGEDMCMWVPDGTPREQVKMVFTRYHIAIRSKDILSRCIMCNSSSYTIIDSNEMLLTFELKHDIGLSEMPEDQMSESNKIDLSNFTLCENGTEIQLDFISPSKLDRSPSSTSEGSWVKLFSSVTDFYVCNECGKVFWEGSHHKAVREKFSDMIDKRESDPSAYGKPG